MNPTVTGSLLQTQSTNFKQQCLAGQQMEALEIRICSNEFISGFFGTCAGDITVVVYDNDAAGYCTISKKLQRELRHRINVDIKMY